MRLTVLSEIRIAEACFRAGRVGDSSIEALTVAMF
jgi:hypothetical protein